MSFEFSTVADDFFVNMNLQTTLALPSARETVLHFCEAVQRDFRDMTSFFQRESGEFVLEGDRERGSYPWMELQSHRLSSGSFNPDSPEQGYRLHRWLLDRSVYFLGVSGLDVEALDVLFGFNFDFRGNRDEVAARALLGDSPLAALVLDGPGRCIECEPNLVVALDESCSLQGRLSMETRSSSYQVRTGNYAEEPISVYFTLRRYPEPGEVLDLCAAFDDQCCRCEDIARRYVLPHVLQPLAAMIAAGG